MTVTIRGSHLLVVTLLVAVGTGSFVSGRLTATGGATSHTRTAMGRARSYSPAGGDTAQAAASQQPSSADKPIMNDLHSAALAEESYFTDNGNYVGATGVSTTTPDLTPSSADGTALAADGLKFSPTGDYNGGTQGIYVVAAWNGSGTSVTTNAAFTGGYCLAAQSASGHWFAYNSTNSGLDNTPLSAAPGTAAGQPCAYS